MTEDETLRAILAVLERIEAWLERSSRGDALIVSDSPVQVSVTPREKVIRPSVAEAIETLAQSQDPENAVIRRQIAAIERVLQDILQEIARMPRSAGPSSPVRSGPSHG